MYRYAWALMIEALSLIATLLTYWSYDNYTRHDTKPKYTTLTHPIAIMVASVIFALCVPATNTPPLTPGPFICIVLCIIIDWAYALAMDANMDWVGEDYCHFVRNHRMGLCTIIVVSICIFFVLTMNEANEYIIRYGQVK